MAKQIWMFLINTFLVNTTKSMKKALSLTIDHLAKLTANEIDAEIAAMKAAFLPYHLAFVQSYNQLNSKLGIYKGATMSTEQMLQELKDVTLNAWRGKVFNIYPEGTVNAMAIFPQGRKPFNNGTYEQRIEAVGSLYQTLITYTTVPELVTLAGEVLIYYNLLLGTRALQQNDEGSVKVLRTNLKVVHGVLCVWLFRNLGLLIAKYAENPALVLNYFDTTLLRKTSDKPDVVKTGNVGANMQLYISLEGVALTAATNIIFLNTITTPGSIIRAQFQSDINAPLDEARNFVAFQSLFGEVDTDAETAGFNLGGGYIYLVLYANNTQGAFKITIEQ